MRDITISIDVFAAIWALRQTEEQSENDILQRVLSDYAILKRGVADSVAPVTATKSLRKESSEPGEALLAPKEVKSSKEGSVAKISLGDSGMGKIRWVDDVRATLRALGGHASLHEIYKGVAVRRRDGNRSVPRTLEATVRRTLEDHSSDSKNFRGVDLFANIGRGEWALRDTLEI